MPYIFGPQKESTHTAAKTFLIKTLAPHQSDDRWVLLEKMLSIECVLFSFKTLLSISTMTLHFYKHTLLIKETLVSTGFCPTKRNPPRTPKGKAFPTGSHWSPCWSYRCRWAGPHSAISIKQVMLTVGNTCHILINVDQWPVRGQSHWRMIIPISILPYPDRRATQHAPCCFLRLPPSCPTTTSFLRMLGLLSFHSIPDFCSWQGLFLPTPTVILAVFFKYGYPAGYGR